MFSVSAVAAPVSTVRAEAGKLRELRDEELLRRFFKQREDGAFEALVERYGGMVYGICRRVLGEAADAEDAFQATFLVLVRKGGTLRDPGRLGNWLYGVANRTARKVRAKIALRNKTERQATVRSTSEVGDMTLDELRAVLDEEISKLPQKYALPLVLCYLEGKTNAQAAAELGWPEGSMSRRLSRGRELLKSRLARRGLAMSAALIAAVFSKTAAASVPPSLVASTVHAASLVHHGAVLEEVVSPAVASVIKEVLAGMTFTSKLAAGVVAIAAGLLIGGTAVVWSGSEPATQGGPVQVVENQPPQEVKGSNRVRRREVRIGVSSAALQDNGDLVSAGRRAGGRSAAK